MRYLKNPNLPDSDVLKAIVSSQISKESEYTLNSLGVELVKIPETDKLYDAIKAHPDIRLCHLGRNNILAEPDTKRFIEQNFPDANICTGCNINGSYPGDIAYNTAIMGEFVICNKANTDINILNYAKEHGMTVIDVRQGYTKCNMAIIAKNAVITSDKGIYDTLRFFPIDVLIVEDNSILLKNLNHGFLGGATGKIAPDKLTVNGNINYHKYKDEITKFAYKYNVEIISLNNEQIEDIGSILPILEK